MKRIPVTGWLGTAIAALTLACVGVFGVAAIPSAEATPETPEAITTLEATTAPDRPQRMADFVAWTTARDQCVWKGYWVGLGTWWILVDFFHYGQAHVTLCWYTNTQRVGEGSYGYCYKYVWGPGIANPYWELYRQGFYPTVSCWGAG